MQDIKNLDKNEKLSIALDGENDLILAHLMKCSYIGDRIHTYWIILQESVNNFSFSILLKRVWFGIGFSSHNSPAGPSQVPNIYRVWLDWTTLRRTTIATWSCKHFPSWFRYEISWSEMKIIRTSRDLRGTTCFSSCSGKLFKWHCFRILYSWLAEVPWTTLQRVPIPTAENPTSKRIKINSH